MNATETGRQDLSAVGAGDVVRSTVTLSAVLGHAVVGLIDRIAGGRGYILVTGLTPRSTELEVIEPTVSTTHEFLLANTPTGGYRGEGSEAVMLTETARTVMTEREGNEVTVVVAIVRFSEEGDQRVAACAAVCLRLACSGGRPHIGRAEDDEILLVRGTPVVDLAVQLRTEHEVCAVFVDVEVIGDDGVPHPFEPVLLFGLHGVLVVRNHAFRNGISEETLFLLGIVDTRGRADIESLDGVDIDEHVTEHTPVGIAVVLVALQD